MTRHKEPKSIFNYISAAIFVFVAVIPLLTLTFHSLPYFSGAAAISSALTESKLIASIAVYLFTSFLAAACGILLAAFLFFNASKNLTLFVYAIMLIPFFMPQYTYAVALYDFLHFAGTGHISPQLLTSMVYFLIYMPIASLIFFTGMTSIPQSMIEYTLTVTTKFSATKNIIIPHLKNYIISAIATVFVLSVSEFTVPAFFGATTFSTTILTEFTAFYDFDTATLHSLILATVVLLLFIPFNKSLRTASFPVQDKKNRNSRHAKATHAVTLFIATVYILPAAYNGISVILHPSYLAKALDSLSDAIATSLFTSLSATVLSLVISVTAAIHLYFNRKNSLTFYLSLFMFAIPSVTIGLSIIYFFNSGTFSSLYHTLLPLMFGLTAKYTFIPLKIISDSTSQIPYNIYEASKISGISDTAFIRAILLRRLRRTIITSFLIVFALNFSETTMSIMLYPPGHQPLTAKVFTLMANSSVQMSKALNFSIPLIELAIFIILTAIIKAAFRNDRT